MSTQKRGRACEACSKIKIKCALGNDPNASPPCERCLRLGKSCILTKPQRQKDRVQELEAQVAALTKLLQKQGITNPEFNDAIEENPTLPSAVHPDSASSALAAQKKRKLDRNAQEARRHSLDRLSSLVPTSRDGEPLAQLDHIVSRKLQEACLRAYRDQYLPFFPLVCLFGDSSLSAMRKERPTLLKAVVYAASPGILSEDAQDDVGTDLLSTLARLVVADGQQSFELLQSLLMTCLYARSSRKSTHMATYQLVHFADEMIVNLGLGDPSKVIFAIRPSTASRETIDAIEASKAFLASNMLSSTLLYLLRRPKARTWSSYHETCLALLPCDTESPKENGWLARYFQCERLCEQVVDEMKLSEPDEIQDLTHRDSRARLRRCCDHISNWEKMADCERDPPELRIWGSVATIYTHEIVLHTETNHKSFAAPFVADRLSTTDFPRPVVSASHVSSLTSLRAALHDLLDLTAELGTEQFAALPALLYTSRVAYALYMLVKLYIALTAPGNSYGAILPADSLAVEAYLDKAIALGDKLAAIDARSGPARVMSAAARLKQWFLAYQPCESPALSGLTGELPVDGGVSLPMSTTDLIFDPDDLAACDWESMFPFANLAYDWDAECSLSNQPSPPGMRVRG